MALIEKIKRGKHFDYLANVGEDPYLGYAGAETDTRYYYDLVHHTDAGYLIRGQILLGAGWR